MAKLLEVRDGAEVSVETGLGWITKVDEPKGRNCAVEIRAEHLQNPVKGWCDTASTELYDLVRRACADGVRISYRIVVKRKRGQADDVPLEAIHKNDRIRDLESIEVVAGVVAGSAAPRPPDAPAAPPAASSAPDPAPAAQDVPAALVCPNCDGRLNDGRPVRRLAGALQHVECPPAGAPADVHPSSAAPDSRGPGGASTVADGKRGPRIAEARPWEFYNSDGSVNPGSYAYMAAEGTVLLANDLLLARNKVVASTAGGGFLPPSQGQVKSLAKRLLRAADRAQAALRGDGHVARMDASHSRCRAAVRAALEVYPVPWGQADAYDQWETDLAVHAGVLLRVTVDLLDPEPLP